MADVQIAIIDQQNTQIALAAPPDTQVTAAVPGVQGPKGEGVPTGGTANQVLFKQSGTNYDTAWGAITSAMIGDLQIVDGDVSTTAAIAGTKISPNFGAQNVVTTGTSTAASFIPTSSTVPTNGVYLPAANSVAISTNGTGRLFIDASGNVGVGGAAPSVGGGYRNFLIKGASTDRTGILRLEDGDGTLAGLFYANEVNGLEVRQELARPITFWTNTTEKLRITSTGQLSHIGAGSSGSPAVSFNGSAPSNSLVITSAGLVGVGTSSPSTLLTVNSSYAGYGGASITGDTCLLSVIGSAEKTIRIDGGPYQSGTCTANLHLSNSGANNFNAVNTGFRLQANYNGTTGVGYFSIDSSAYSGSAYAYTPRLRIDGAGNVGIGTTSPIANLHVVNPTTTSEISLSGGTTAANYSQIGFYGGSTRNAEVSANSAFLTLTHQNSGVVRVETGGTERARIDSSGRLGIGTSSPVGKINSVISQADTASASDTTLANSFLHLGGGEYGSGRYFLTTYGYSTGRTNSGAYVGALGTESTGYGKYALVFGTRDVTTDAAPTERLRITSAGLVGIGTSSPASQLDVSDGSVANTQSPKIYLCSENGADRVACEIRQGRYNRDVLVVSSNQSLSANLFNAIENGTSRFVITGAGNVGIGTTSPGRLLEVQNTNSGTDGFARISSTANGAFVEFAPAGANTIRHYTVGSAVGGSLVFFDTTANSQRAAIDSSGRLLVGTSTALAIGGENAAKLQLIDASATSAGWFNLARFANSAGANAIQFGKSRGTTVGDYTIVQNGDTLGSITFAGADGTDLGSYGAQIKAEVDGTPGTNDMPGRLVFSTTADGASSPTERLRIDSSGRVGIGTTASPAGASIKLTLDGSNGGGIELVAANDGGGALVPSAGGGVQFYTHTGAVGSESYSERARIDGAGRLLVGASTSRSGGLLQVETTGSGLSRVHSLVNNSNDVTAPVLKFTKTRGTTVGAVTAVQNGDDLAYIAFSGTDGTSVLDGAWISAIVDGTPGTNDLPTRLTFSTTANGASSPTERVRITSTGQVRLAGAGITFNGDTATANELDDYEEGTWTPSLGGTWTANPADLSGKYVKIGRAVYVAIYFAGGAKSTSTSGYFTGLPFLTNDPGTGQCVDSNVTDCGGALFSNNDRLWISGTSFAGFTQVTGVYFT